MRHLYPISLVGLGLLAGCSTPPPEPLHTPRPQEQHATNLTETASSPFPQAWWTTFNDPALDRLIQSARGQNRDLAQAAARIDAARARAKLAGVDAALLATFSGGAQRQRTSENTAMQFGKNQLSQVSGELEFSYEIDLWGRIRASRAAAEKAVVLSSEERKAVEITICSQVAKQHLSRLALLRERDVVQRQIERYNESEKLQAARVEAGFATELDLQRVRVEKATREGELAQLQERGQALAVATALLCGQTPDAASTNAPEAQAVLPEVPKRLSLALLDARPDVAAKRSAWEAQYQRVQVARAEFYPSFRLAGTFGYAAEHPEDLLEWRSRLWSLVGSLTAPVLEGGRLKANLELSNAQLREAAAAYEASVLTAYREVADALNALRSLDDQNLAAQRVRDAAARALALSHERYEKGFATYLEVVESDRSLLAAQRSLIQIAALLQTATVDLIRALGIP